MKIKKKYLYLLLPVVMVIITAVFIILKNRTETIDESTMTVTVAWNPHSIADVLARALFPDAQIQNITGANGANGADAVFRAEHDGNRLLSTTLSALINAETMGFGDSAYDDWEAWLCAFSPAVVVVAADSPYETIHDLLNTSLVHGMALIGADSGFGSVSFTASEILRDTVFEFENISYAGSSPAINALINGEAHFAVLISAEIAPQLRAGELRALCAFTDNDFIMYNAETEMTIPSVRGVNRELDANLPLGEYFGLFAPTDIPAQRVNALNALIQSAAASDLFIAFLHEKGLAAVYNLDN